MTIELAPILLQQNRSVKIHQQQTGSGNVRMTNYIIANRVCHRRKVNCPAGYRQDKQYNSDCSDYFSHSIHFPGIIL